MLIQLQSPMLILLVCLFLFIAAIALLILRVTQPNARYTWLIAAGGAGLAFLSVFAWLGRMPFEFAMPAWKPQALFPTPVLFRADGAAWALCAAITALTLAILSTAVTRPIQGNSISWAGILILGGMGVLAATADNPLTLLLIWSFLDLTELITQLSSVNGARNSERAVISFSTRVSGSGLLLWSYIESFSGGNAYVFQSMPANASALLVIAAGLRLGVLPLHLPYDPASTLRRGFGTALRLIGAVSTLSVLGHIQITSMWATPILMTLASIAALYGGWMWLRAPDELNGRPYWMIGIASLSVLSALSGNPIGATAWTCALILTGGALFLSSVHDARLSRLMLVGAWSLSSLPFSLTAAAWLGGSSLFSPFAIAAQALMTAGFIRHALRAAGDESLDDQPAWAKVVYRAGIILPIVLQVLLGFFGWDGAGQIGNWIFVLPASILTLGLLWATRRFRVFNPVRAHWIRSAGAGVNNLYQWLWSIYFGLARLGQTVTQALEGEGGIMWTLLFLVLFVSIIAGGIQ